MLIIVEGIDKTGKTTLINYLLRNIPKSFLLKLGDTPKSNNPYEREKIKQYYWKMLSAYKMNFKDCILIMDRFFISELVYCHKRGYDAWKDSEIQMLKEELENMHDVLIIHCKTNIEQIKSKFEDEDYTKIDEIEILMKRYSDIIPRLKIETWPYDYTLTKPEQVLNKIMIKKQILEKEQRMVE